MRADALPMIALSRAKDYEGGQKFNPTVAGVDLRHRVEQALLDNWRRLFGYALSLTRNEDEANDLLQQAAVAALATAAGPDQDGATRAWLFRIVRNVWIDRFRSERVRKTEELTTANEPVDAAWSFDDRLIAELTVRSGLERLDPVQREIITLVDINGFRYVEAAEILQVPVGTVMSRLSRARLALLEAIGESSGGPVTHSPETPRNVHSLDAARRRIS